MSILKTAIIKPVKCKQWQPFEEESKIIPSEQ